MSQIIVSDLRPAGSDLLIDSESYLQNLTDAELSTTKGGITPALLLLDVAIWAYVGYKAGSLK